MRRLSQTDYFDIMLLHYLHTDDWREKTKQWQDAILVEQDKKTIHTRGCSVHGLPALRQVPGMNWLQVAMIRMNHNGAVMDAEDYATNRPGNVPEVVSHVKQVKSEGMGVISMKLIGNGSFTNHDDRVAAMKFAFRNAGVDSVTVGFKNTQEIDEAIDNLNAALA
jgi:predicted aldo/keto reductase-like oxidoreductase